MSSIKSWERPWSMDEMIENANNWSLAGDVALLNTLQEFADKLLEKARITDGNIENLCNNLEKTSLELNIAQNRFQSLRNTQFIESRVYEDDETLPQVDIEHKKVIEDKDADHTADIRSAITRGLDVLDRYFDTVEVSVSDSEDDELPPNYVLRPKDLYIDRPLPYVIGTDEWHQKWHVGLEDSSDDDDDDGSDTEKISDNYSETDSESTDLQLTFDRSQVKSDTSSSELDFSKRDASNHHQQSIKDDQQSISGSEEAKSLPTNFAQQLAEKLDRVVGTATIQMEPEPVADVNTRPLHKVPTKIYSDVFFDEPPPLEDAPVAKTGLFSGGGGLFDDNDDDLWSSQSSEVPRQHFGGNRTNEHQRGLFDHDSDDDDDIFNKKREQTKVLPTVYHQPKPQLPVFDEEPPPVEGRKKPIGGVSIFGNNDLLNKKLLKRRQDEDQVEDQDAAIAKNKQNIDNNDRNGGKVVEKPTKKITLFDADDDDNDLFKDDLLSGNITSKKFTSTLFNDDDDDNDLFVEEVPKNEASEQPDTSNSINTLKSNDDSMKLFDTTSTDDLFNDFPKENPRTSINNKKKDGLTSKLFDFDDDDNDLFKLEVDQKETNDGKQLKKPDVSLFDPTPPIDFGDDDDDWETKPDDNDHHQNTKFASKSLFDDDDAPPELHENQPSIMSRHSFLDETPPLLSEENDKTAYKDGDDDDDNNDREDVRKVIQTPPNKLKHHNLNINVAALIPGAIAPSKRREIPEINDDGNDIPQQIEVKNSDPLVDKEIVTSLDTTDHVEVLQSVTKDRAKLPLNRRPSTRRGRKAALTTSSKDFKLQEDDDEKFDVKNDDSRSDLFGGSKSNDDFDDLFKNVGKVINGDQRKFEVKPANTSISDVKTELKIDDNPVKDDKRTNLITTQGLFDDDDDDNDGNSELFQTKKSVIPKKPTKSLFNDLDDDDDDIFKTTISHSKKPEIKVATERKLVKSSNTGGIKKQLDHSQPDDDPLGILMMNSNEH